MSAKHTFMAWDYQTESAGKKLVLLQIANNSNDDGVSWYSIEKMAIACGMGERTFHRHLKELEQDQVIEINRRPNRTSVYRLTWWNCQNGTNKESGTAKMAPSNCQNGTSMTAKMADDPKTSPKIDLESIFVRELFEKFWRNYPVKVGRKPAEKSFNKVMRGLNRSQAIMLMNMILNYHSIQIESGVLGSDKLHASTLLNQERWNDNPEFVEQFKSEWIEQNANNGTSV